MEELRNILIYVRHLKIELQKENNTNENIKFNNIKNWLIDPFKTIKKKELKRK